MSIQLSRQLTGVGLCLLALMGTALATPYWTPEQIAAEFAGRETIQEPRFVLPDAHRRPATLDDREYFLHYSMLCDFLVEMQFTGAGVNNGGMIEGESGGDQFIIQTDNTQEAIRVWSQYAIWTGDTASYGPAIRLAQGYCGRFPAWREEGGGYYAAHNCGWGFEAVWKYREAYQDTSWNWYADSCAWWTASHPLTYDPNSTGLGQLDPLAEGLAIGGMYPHAVYRDHTAWRDYTLVRARRLRQWFQSNPARLNANETWALCGGTALWGVCSSLFAAYPDSGQLWLTQYAPQLDIWQSTGQWNHSFCTWYGNAQFAVWEILQDSTYWENGVYICDSLIGLDTDDDGGIYPGRVQYSPTNDHSWVSAYMGWMGMERIINAGPIVDAAIVELVTPDPDRPQLAGDSMTVSVRFANAGATALSVLMRVEGAQLFDTARFELGVGVDSVWTLAQPWVVADADTLPPRIPLLITLSAEGDEDSTNDTLLVEMDIRRSVNITGSVWSGNPPEGVGGGQVSIYHEGYPTSEWAVLAIQPDGSFSNGTERLMAGNNQFVVVPPARYMGQEQTFNLVAGDTPQEISIELTPTDVLLMDDDAGAAYETYLTSSLDSFDVAVRKWDPLLYGTAVLTGIPTVIWMTGDDSVTTLTAADRTALTNYLSGGGRLLLTGQNIADDLEIDGWQFLTTVLHCSTHTRDTDSRIIAGIAGDSLTDGMTLYLIGTQGAGNQTSPASVYVLEGAREILRYNQISTEPCGVAGEYGSGKYVFLSFGLEAVSGVNNSTTRDEFLAAVFEWFADSTSGTTPHLPIPQEIALAAFPNPFNPSTTIHFFAPPSEQRVRLTMYNVMGQEMRVLYDGPGRGDMSLTWNGLSDAGLPVASGTYYCRLSAGHETRILPIQLIR